MCTKEEVFLQMQAQPSQYSSTRMEMKVDEESNLDPVPVPKPKRPHIDVEDSFLHILHEVNLAVEILIRQYETQHAVNIVDYEVQKEAVMGTYFVAGVLRLNFSFQTSDQHFDSSVILKVPQLGVCQDLGRQMCLYDKEKFVYEEVIPLMYESWTRENVAPHCYGSTDLGILVLENLKEIGYYQKERGTQLTLTEAKVVLRSLAQFHGLSLKHIQDVRTQIDSLTMPEGSLEPFQSTVFPGIVKKLKKYVFPHTSQRTCEAFEAYFNQLDQVLKLGMTSNEEGFSVIIHGDLHYYNLMFRNDKYNNLAQCKLIDFQWSRRGSPIFDIMVFLVTSLDAKTFEKSCESLFACYLNTLASTVHELHLDESFSYGMKELLADFEKYRLCFLYHLTVDVPIFWAGHRDLRTIDEENDLDVVLSSPKYITFFNIWIKYLLCIGPDPGLSPNLDSFVG